MYIYMYIYIYIYIHVYIYTYIYIYIISQKSALKTFSGGAMSCCSVLQSVAVCCNGMQGRQFASTW